MMKSYNNSMRVLALCLCLGATVQAANVPLELPRPDGEPGDQSKPVKVYILAGQSNMFGFGELDGATPRYESIMLTADPNAIPGDFNKRKIMRHGMYQKASGDASGATAAIYQAAYDPELDYASMKPVRQTTVPLGTVSATLPAIDDSQTLVARAFIDVPETGTYTLHAGYESSTHSVVTLDGEAVYRKIDTEQPVVKKIELEADKRYPITVTYAKGGSAAFWMEQTGLQGHGDLTKLTQRDNKYTWFIDDEGQWTERKDVTYIDTRTKKESGGLALSPTVNGNGKRIGPEVPFGYVMGTYHDEPVLLIESSMGNRALYWDFRPPSSGRPNPDSKWEGLEYRLMVEGVQYALENLETIVPGYQGQGYEIVGFAWWQGHKDKGQSKAEYEGHLVNLIKDLRKDLNAPDMLAAVASVGFHGWDLPKAWQGVFDAQMAVGDPEQHPEFAGEVASIDIRGFWREADKSPTGVDYHYNFNAETYVLTGDALARAMIQMLGGDVAMRPIPEAPEQVAAPSTKPTEAQIAASNTALKPMIIDGLIPEYIGKGSYPQSNRGYLIKETKSAPFQGGFYYKKPRMVGLLKLYQKAGIHEYDWHDFGPEWTDMQWHYLTFDPPEEKEPGTGTRYREVTLPEGMENWYKPGFDPEQAGWKTGKQPFGQKNGKLVTKGRKCRYDFCRCGEPMQTLWENEVLLMRNTFKFPKFKEGFRYRLVVGGMSHVNVGDGYRIYVNGKLMKERERGVGKREGGAPLGYDIDKEWWPAFNSGETTIAATSFLEIGEDSTQRHFSVWLQEMKVPPMGQDVIRTSATRVPMLSAEWQALQDPARNVGPNEGKFVWDGEFVPNPGLLGSWTQLGTVASIDGFDPAASMKSDANSPLQQITFREQGHTNDRLWIWSGNKLMDLRKNQALEMTPKTIDGSDYLFIETGGFNAKNGPDWKPSLYVMKRTDEKG